jgi:hypothetical protein
MINSLHSIRLLSPSAEVVDMNLLRKVKRLPAQFYAWLNASPREVPVDLREFEESQRRLYEKSTDLESSSDDFTRMVNQMTRKRGRRKVAQ